MGKYWCKELPQGFEEVFTIDAKDKKTSVKMLILSLIITIVVMIPFALDFFATFNVTNTKNIVYLYFAFLASIVIYTMLHELVHGVVYKFITHQKLTYGLTLTVAFCGVPDLYIKRSAVFYAILAPFTVFTILFGTVLIIIPHTAVWYLLSVLFAIHIGGCIGDLWGTLYMATHYRNKTMYVNDTGPKQTFFIQN